MDNSAPDITGLPFGHEVIQSCLPNYDASPEIKLYRESWYNVYMVLPDENKKPHAKLIRKERVRVWVDDRVEKEIIPL